MTNKIHIMTYYNMSCEDAYQQQKQRALYNIPPFRFNLTTPYVYLTDATNPLFSKQQLDMRRKVEILKHTKNNSKQNQFTQKSKYSLMSKSSSSQMSQYAINAFDTNPTGCPTNVYKATPNSACDVPGPLLFLQNDPTVPLYNYNTGVYNRTLALLPPSAPYQYNIFTKNEIQYLNQAFNTIRPDIRNPLNVIDSATNIISASTTTDVGALIIGTLINQGDYSFSLSSPIGFWMVGYIDQSKSRLVSHNININISSVYLQVFYNQTPILANAKQVYPSYGNGLSDISFNVQNLNKVKTTNFYTIQYIGTLNLINVTLPVQPGYIYEIQLTFNYTYAVQDFVNMQTIDTGHMQTGIFSNLSVDNTNVLYNSVLDSGANLPFVPGSFVFYTTTPAF